MENILQKINQSGLKLLETLTPADTYAAVVNEAIRLVDAEYGSILLNTNEHINRVYASDPFFSRLKIRKGGTIETAYQKNKVIVNNITAHTKVDPLIREKKIQSVILIPLRYRGETIGILTVLSLKKEHFTPKQVDMLRVFGSMASIAIKKSQLYSETKKALEIRDMFISMAAHELRTPLTSISGYIQLLYSRMAGKNLPESKWIEALYEENKRMMHLVKEILEVNRLRAGQLQFRWQECVLDSILNDGIKEIGLRHPGRKLDYKNLIKGEARIIGDSERLVQVFVNVFDNAIKYSPHSSPVLVRLNKKGNSFHLSIQDFGKGIDEKDLPYIFEGQHRGGGGEEGFGIGLFFVENIVRLHRGSINIESEIHKGTIITIQLPAAKYYSN